MSAFAVGLAIVAAGAPASATQDASARGRLVGMVTLSRASGPASGASAYTRRSVGPRPTPQPETRNVVVYIDGLAGARDLRPMREEIGQKGEQFVPHVVAVTAGSTVSFPNQDPFFHNVFSLSRSGTFDLGRYPPGSSRQVTLSTPGIVKVFCHIHSHMSAVIRVFDHPWFAVPSAGGAFALEGIPAGVHTLVAWHERIGESRRSIRIQAGETTSVKFTLPVLEEEP